MNKNKKILIDKDFLHFLLRDKMQSICEGNCDECIFGFARKRYNISLCEELTTEQLLEVSMKLWKDR